MKEHTTVSALDVVKSYNAGLGANMGDWDAMRAHLDKHLTSEAACVEATSLPWGGTWVGPDGWLEMFQKGTAAFEASPLTLGGPGVEDTYTVEGSTVVRRNCMTVIEEATGTATDLLGVEIYEVGDDGIESCNVYFFDTALMAAKIAGSPA
jgi:hypothetical protein